MRLFLTFLVLVFIVVILGAGGNAGYRYLEEKKRPSFRTAKVDMGDIEESVNATGNVKPILTVQVGSFVSGPIVKLEVDFNDRVMTGDLLAQIDTRLFLANVRRDEATLTTREAEVKRTEALLRQAQRDEKRAQLIQEENADFISGAEMDQVIANRASLEAQLEIATASVEQASAALKNSEANLGYCDITATHSGIIIDRKIQPGQTLAAQFQTPELFHIAVDLDREVHVLAAIDESDIGAIEKALAEGRPVQFTVDAHRDDLFDGEIYQIRLNATTTQNVVTYPVVVIAANTEMKLLPGMTASLSFQTNEKRDIKRIPNAALRFFPTNTKWVHKDDRKLLDGSMWDDDEADTQISAKQKHTGAIKRKKRHVWIHEGEFLRAVEVELGISDTKYTELISGDLTEDQELVTGLKAKRK